MSIRDIFVPLAPAIDFDPQLDAAARLASRLNAQVNVVFTRPDAVMTAANVPEMLAAAGVVVEVVEHESKLAETSAIIQFEEWRAANSLVGATWHERIGSITEAIIEVGRVSDLIVIGRSDPYEVVTEEMFTAAIYSTGRPTMIVPDRLVGDPLDHILIAWNGSLEAARAIAGAMPMLEAAGRVSIFTVPENPKALYHHLGLIDYLKHHDVHAEWVEPSFGSSDLGLRLMKTAANEKASMIVMGAYTHHRVREAFLGGVTQHVLKHTDIPILMMH